MPPKGHRKHEKAAFDDPRQPVLGLGGVLTPRDPNQKYTPRVSRPLDSGQTGTSNRPTKQIRLAFDEPETTRSTFAGEQGGEGEEATGKVRRSGRRASASETPNPHTSRHALRPASSSRSSKTPVDLTLLSSPPRLVGSPVQASLASSSSRRHALKPASSSRSSRPSIDLGLLSSPPRLVGSPVQTSLASSSSRRHALQPASSSRSSRPSIDLGLLSSPPRLVGSPVQTSLAADLLSDEDVDILSASESDDDDVHKSDEDLHSDAEVIAGIDEPENSFDITSQTHPVWSAIDAIDTPAFASDPAWVDVMNAFLSFCLGKGFFRGPSQTWQRLLTIPDAAKIWARRVLIGFSDAQLRAMANGGIRTLEDVLTLFPAMLAHDTRCLVYIKLLESVIHSILHLGYIGSTFSFWGGAERTLEHMKTLVRDFHKAMALGTAADLSNVEQFNRLAVQSKEAYECPTKRPRFHVFWLLPLSFSGLYAKYEDLRHLWALHHLGKLAESFGMVFLRTLSQAPNLTQLHLTPALEVATPTVFCVPNALFQPGNKGFPLSEGVRRRKYGNLREYLSSRFPNYKLLPTSAQDDWEGFLFEDVDTVIKFRQGSGAEALLSHPRHEKLYPFPPEPQNLHILWSGKNVRSAIAASKKANRIAEVGEEKYRQEAYERSKKNLSRRVELHGEQKIREEMSAAHRRHREKKKETLSPEAFKDWKHHQHAADRRRAHAKVQERTGVAQRAPIFVYGDLEPWVDLKGGPPTTFCRRCGYATYPVHNEKTCKVPSAKIDQRVSDRERFDARLAQLKSRRRGYADAVKAGKVGEPCSIFDPYEKLLRISETRDVWFCRRCGRSTAVAHKAGGCLVPDEDIDPRMEDQFEHRHQQYHYKMGRSKQGKTVY